MKFEKLDSQSIKSFHLKDDSVIFFKLALIIIVWAALGTGVMMTSSWILKSVLWIVVGFFLNGLVQLWHDSWHYTLFRKKSWNIIAGYMLGSIWGVLFEPSQHAHLAHHKYNRTLQDPDAYNVGKKSIFLVVSYYLIIHFGFIMSITHYNVFYPLKYFHREDKVRHYFILLAFITFYSILFAFLYHINWLREALEVWLIPVIFMNFWAGYKSVADHYKNIWKGNDFETATTITTNAFWRYFWNGLNYHLEHHLYPQVPGYNLHSIHQKIRDELNENKAIIYGSYFNVFLGCLRVGPTFIDEENNFFSLKKNEKE